METKKIKYLYPNKNEYWFCEENNPRERFNLEENIVGNGIKFLKENSLVEALVFSDEIIGLKLPIKIELKVKEAPPSIKGNTSSVGTKTISI